MAIFELECDAPWPVYVDSISRRFGPPQNMKIEACDVEIVDGFGVIQLVESGQDSPMQPLVDLGTARLPK